MLLLEGGSSPLTRGKLNTIVTTLITNRLIPAHAGKTEAAQGRWMSRWAHPRSRGENYRLRSASITLSGSSPLTRGKRKYPSSVLLQSRLIPAHAGKTFALCVVADTGEAHPRSRGENLLQVLSELIKRGSSPLTRGKLEVLSCFIVSDRLIPAHAGKTQSGSQRRQARAAHPRSRGENTAQKHFRRLKHGSSPLTRGKPPSRR